MVLNFWKLFSSSALATVTLENNSVNRIRSSIMGVAKSESSHVLCTTIVLWPSNKISDVYSSKARLLSPN